MRANPCGTGPLASPLRLAKLLFLGLFLAVALDAQSGPTLGNTNLPAAFVGTAYSSTLTVTGGVPPYSWSFSGSLPPGVFVNTAGTVTGTPTAAGIFNFTVTVTDSNGSQGSAALTLTVNPAPLLITTVSPLFSGTVGAPYAQTLTASGGNPPYSWAITSGTAGGLTLDPLSAVLQGTPQNAGTFTFSVRVSDSAGASATQTFSVVVAAPALTITVGSALPAGAVGASYSQKLPVSAAGGTPPYTWSLTGVPVPGLTFDPATLALSGTPTTTGTFTLTVQLADSAGLTATKGLSLTVGPAALTITTARQLPDGALNTAYSQRIAATGGAPPYTWSASGLPAGLTIDSTSGLISGTPTAAGSFAIAITVTDSALTRYVDRFTVNVNLPPAPPVTISGLPSTADPAKQFPLQISLGSSYPSLITGQAILSFSPDAGLGDKTILFASGGTTASFTIPAGSTNAVTDVPLAIQTGTVSGTIGISLRLQAGGVDITPSPAPGVATQIVRAAPVIGNVVVSRTATAISLALTGYSTGREVTQAVFAFQAASGQTLQSAASTITVDVTSVFSTWFQDASSSQFGSQFLFTQPFTVQGDPTAVIPVSVTLTNRVGSTTFAITP